jgi:hypothetical protein
LIITQLLLLLLLLLDPQTLFSTPPTSTQQLKGLPGLLLCC